jgi:transposase-like protein
VCETPARPEISVDRAGRLRTVKQEKRVAQAVDRAAPPDPEVAAQPTRRRFTAQYKLRVLKEAEALRESGQIGELLRKEGLYSSHLRNWRAQRDAGALVSLGQKRGRRRKPRDMEKERLEKEIARLHGENQQLRAINEIQKKISQLLGIPLETPERDGSI